MQRIVLTTFNARFAHAAFGLRYLLANMGDLRQQTRIIEFDLTTRPADALEAILAQEPKIVGLGVYIWNADISRRFVASLKRIRPDVIVILGGPEVSHESDQQEICRLADYVVAGEADLAFAQLCRQLLCGARPLQKLVQSPLPEFSALELPYELYDASDIANRVIYVEASRGCPFKCEFCLSSLDVPVRNVPIDKFLGAMQSLLDRGVRQFKFVDRTFNLNLSLSRAILEFFLDRYQPGMFLHFEMIPDRLPVQLREVIRRFARGSLQFEVGIQTFNEQVQQLISRRQDNAKVEDNLRWLREKTTVHVHADLIAGLPGEDLDSFARGFERLYALRPQEIQVGLLKRLRGTPIVRHDQQWGMVYSPDAPYQILQTKLIDFPTMQRLARFARYWDLIANSGNFIDTTELICRPTPFQRFLELSDWLFARSRQTHSIALNRLAEMIFEYLTQDRKRDPSEVATVMFGDYQRSGRNDHPKFLRRFFGNRASRRSVAVSIPPRQARHLKLQGDLP